MSQLKAYILAARPKTLFASAGPVLLGTGLSLFLMKQSAGKIELMLFPLILLCALLLQVGTNLVNDYFDAKSGVDASRSHGPPRVTQSGLLSPLQVKRGYQLVFGLAFILGFFLMIKGGLPIMIIGLSSLLFAYIYTGGPFPISHYGLGELAAFIFFGPVAVWGTGYLLTGQHHPLFLLAGAGPGLISAMLMSINNLRDRKDDKNVGKKTIAVLTSEKSARRLTLSLLVLSALIPLSLAFFLQSWNFVALVALPLLFLPHWITIAKAPIGPGLNVSLAATGKYLFLYCLILGILLSLQN